MNQLVERIKYEVKENGMTRKCKGGERDRDYFITKNI